MTSSKGCSLGSDILSLFGNVTADLVLWKHLCLKTLEGLLCMDRARSYLATTRQCLIAIDLLLCSYAPLLAEGNEGRDGLQAK